MKLSILLFSTFLICYVASQSVSGKREFQICLRKYNFRENMDEEEIILKILTDNPEKDGKFKKFKRVLLCSLKKMKILDKNAELNEKKILEMDHGEMLLEMYKGVPTMRNKKEYALQLYRAQINGFLEKTLESLAKQIDE